MVIEQLKDFEKDYIKVDFRVDTYKLEDDCFIIADFYTMLNKDDNEIEVTVFQKDEKKLIQITAIVKTHSEGTLFYTSYFVNEEFKNSVRKYRI